MEEDIFRYSRLVDPVEVQQTGCFTTLPVRVSRYDHLAVEASKRFLTEFGETVESEVPQLVRFHSKIGNFSSFLYPESLPERLGLLTYLSEVAFIHDDVTEAMKYEDAMDEHNALATAMDLNQQDIKNAKAAKMKKILSQSLLECLKIDHEMGMDILNSYRGTWLKGMEVLDIDRFQTLDDYAKFRIINAGVEAYLMMIEFSHGKKLSKEDHELIAEAIKMASWTFIFMNDYYSWEKEYRASKDLVAGRLVNVIAFFMRTEGLSVEAAKRKTRNCVLEYEQRFLHEKAQLYMAHPSLPFHVRKFVEVVETAIGGTHYWSANSARYNFWKTETPDLENHIPRATSQGHNGTSSSKPFSEENLADAGSTLDLAAAIKTIESGKTQKEVNDAAKKSIARRESQAADNLTNDDLFHLNRSVLLAPCDYIKSLPSKGFRSSLIDALNVWLEVPQIKLKVIKNVIEMLHNSSLILDDIEDDSPLRRGKTATHNIFGPAQAINSANFLYVSAVQAIDSLKNPEMISAMLEELENLFVGQSWDLYWKVNLKSPTKSEYLAMIDSKTGAMFRMIVRLMQVVSPLYSTYNFDQLVRVMGRLFQIRDDYLNLQGTEYLKQKGFCEDFDEGKFSYPLVHCLETNPISQNLILGIFRQRQGKKMATESKLQILECLEKAGTFDSTLKLLQQLEEGAEKEIEVLESQTRETNPTMRLLLKTLGHLPRMNMNKVAA